MRVNALLNQELGLQQFPPITLVPHAHKTKTAAHKTETADHKAKTASRQSCSDAQQQKSGTQPSKVAMNNNLGRRIKILADLSAQHVLAFLLEMLPEVSGLGFAFAGEK
jgi:hypothetical protein